jgi:hypothetical protein
MAALLMPFGAAAMMAPKFERVRAFRVALEHLWEISSMLAEPIDRIEYIDGGFRFWAGKCFVPVMMEYESPSDVSKIPPPGEGSWTATVGAPQCR